MTEKTSIKKEIWDVTIPIQSSAYYENANYGWSAIYDGITGYWKGHFPPGFLHLITTQENLPFKIRYQWVNHHGIELLDSPTHPIKMFADLQRPTSCAMIPLITLNNAEQLLQRSGVTVGQIIDQNYNAAR